MIKFAIAAAVMAAAFTASPVVAQDEAESGIRTEVLKGPRGVFEGTIGRYPVIACFDARYDDDGFGSYYYLSQLKPIPLAANDAKDRWSEGSVYNDNLAEGAPVWTIRTGKTGNVTGTWRGGKRSYPIKLTRIAQGAEEYEAACGKDSFLGPRIGTPEFIRTPASLGGFDYTVLNYKTPPHFSLLSISGFTFAASQPGDGPIIAKLGAMLPTGSTQDEYAQCMAGNLLWRGEDGDFEMAASPRFANSQLLSVETTNSVYCGGAHPNFWQDYFLYDRQSGEAIDPAGLFNDSGLKLSEYGSKLMQAPLRDVIVAQWPDDTDPECKDAVQDQEYWSIQVLEGGISFQPDFPHVLTACEEQLFLTWDQTSPFLSDEGRKIRERTAR